VIISVPGLYGYAAVIFNHRVFAPYMNALSKLVIFSSLVHQLSFVLFSSMSFAIGTVQDAGLIFLSSMSNTIAIQMLADGASHKAVVSTSIVLLSAGTSLLGVILILIGRMKLANVVSYLPMPVIGGKRSAE
jgi:SulP family sulfate permease